jgi:ATP-dependent Clp protease ATP-binding subunit ClpA
MIPFTPRVKKVLELSLREALSRGHDYIGTEHILLAIAAENEGVASRILLDFDADAEKIRGEVTEFMMGKGPSERERQEPPEPMETFPPITYAQMGQRHSRMHLSREVSLGGQAPWWHPLAGRAHLWFGMVVGALLFGLGLLVGRLIWG